MIAGLCHMPFNTFGTFLFLMYYFGKSFMFSLTLLVAAFFANNLIGERRK